MKITKWLVATYMWDVTDIYAANDPMPPADPREYRSLIRRMQRRAEEAGELDPLRLGIEYVLGHPDEDASPLVAQVFPYSDEAARELLAFVRTLIWETEDTVLLGAPADVEWVNTPLPEWRAQRRP